MFKVEVASKFDLSQIALLEKDFQKQAYVLTSLQAMHQNPNYCFLVIKVNNEVASYAIVCLSDQVDLLKIYTKKTFCQKGMARQLILYIKDQYHKTINVEVKTSNKIANSFYLACNFKKIATRKDYYGKGIDANIYQL